MNDVRERNISLNVRKNGNLLSQLRLNIIPKREAIVEILQGEGEGEKEPKGEGKNPEGAPAAEDEKLEELASNLDAGAGFINKERKAKSYNLIIEIISKRNINRLLFYIMTIINKIVKFINKNLNNFYEDNKL